MPPFGSAGGVLRGGAGVRPHQRSEPLPGSAECMPRISLCVTQLTREAGRPGRCAGSLSGGRGGPGSPKSPAPADRAGGLIRPTSTTTAPGRVAPHDAVSRRAKARTADSCGCPASGAASSSPWTAYRDPVRISPSSRKSRNSSAHVTTEPTWTRGSPAAGGSSAPLPYTAAGKLLSVGGFANSGPGRRRASESGKRRMRRPVNAYGSASSHPSSGSSSATPSGRATRAAKRGPP